MKTTVILSKQNQVRVSRLAYGDGFLDSTGHPYIVMDPNVGNFIVTCKCQPLQVLVANMRNSDKSITLAHVDGSQMVTPCDVEVTCMEVR
jgi:hypothetical protein